MNWKLIKIQLAGCAFFGSLLAVEWIWGLAEVRSLQAGLNYEQINNDSEVELPEMPARSTLVNAELVERPLFIEGRKPVAEAPVSAQENVEIGQIDDWLLVGVYSCPGKQPYAMFNKRSEPKKHLKITKSQIVSGWVLKEIQSDLVVLQQAGQDKKVLLRKPRASSPTQPGAGLKPPPGANPPSIPPGNPIGIPPRHRHGMKPVDPNSTSGPENDDNESAEN